MSMKRTCAISSRKSDLVSADILGLSAKNLRGLSRNQKTGNGCFRFCLVSHSISRQVFTRTVSRDESRMKILIGVPLFFASLALADDFKAIDGKEYKNVEVSRVEPDGIVVKTKSGISKIYFVELPKDVQERFAVQQAEKINYEVSLKDIPGAPHGDRVLELGFDRDVPQPQVVDKMLRESLEHAVAADGSRDIVAIAFLGDEVLSDTQYSGELMYRAAQRKIMTLEEARGVKTTITDAVGYSVKVSEEQTLAGIKPERKWLTISLIYPTPPPLEEAYISMQSEIEKNVSRGMDIDAYVKIGDKG